MDNNYSGGGLGEAILLIFGILVAYIIFSLASYVYTGLTLSAIYKKTGHPQPWSAWIPFYNYWVFLEIGNQKGWWVFVYVGATFISFLPIVGHIIQLAGCLLFLAVFIYALININKGFGKSITAWTWLGAIVPPVWLGILAWGKDTYDSRLANGPYFMNKERTEAQAAYIQSYGPVASAPYSSAPQGFSPVPVAMPQLNPYEPNMSGVQEQELPRPSVIASDAKVSEVIEPSLTENIVEKPEEKE